MLRNVFFALSLFVGLLSAAPVNNDVLEACKHSGILSKRSFPQFIGFDSDPARSSRASVTLSPSLPVDEALQVFQIIVGDNTDGTGSSVIGNEIAFTENINGKLGGAITLCDKAYQFPDLSDKSCDSLSSTVSTLMSTLGGVILHELSHYQEIGNPALGQDVTDHGLPGYGPLNVRTLRSSEASAARVNADNYRWYAQEVYWSNKCSRSYSALRDNRDSGDSTCGGEICVIM
ncbi:hypothetical protein T440DRAFT_522314 [Plenodomus tracheiphilus IPT5]|uniref:Uncharacterized protein n=1 Tax=Plenodomus tracheiphilus IPT5 TaxID=1408161 RepID=A0A6A7ATN7_9PLEO|nr:hypothetical protein T440DRAFT_522314 [Plenodomus tracheiphilus IPT5]